MAMFAKHNSATCAWTLLTMVTVASTPSFATERLVIDVSGEHIYRIALSPTGNFVAGTSTIRKQAGRNESVIYVWDTTSGKLQITLRDVPSVYAQMRFSPDEKQLTTVFASLTGGRHETIIMRWDLATGKRLDSYSLGDGGANKALSAGGKFLVTVQGYPNNTAVLWDLGKKTKIRDLKTDSIHFASAAFDKAGKLVVSGGAKGEIIVREVLSGKLVKKFQGEIEGGRGVDPTVTFVDFSPDGKTVVSWDRNRAVRLWSVADGKLLGTISKVECEQCRFTPDGRILVTANYNVIEFRSAKNLATVLKLATSTTKTRFMDQVTVSKDGRTVALTSSGAGIHVWSVPPFNLKK